MLTTYPEIPADQLARQGKCFISCDVEGCPSEAEVAGITSYMVRDATCYEAPMPDGWLSSDPEDNAMAGAAQFCSGHAEYAPVAAPLPE